MQVLATLNSVWDNARDGTTKVRSIDTKMIIPHTCIHLLQSSSSELPPKPQVSTPNMGIPNRAKFSAWEMLKYMYANKLALSPPQWPAHLPEPAKVERPMMNGRLPGKMSRSAW